MYDGVEPLAVILGGVPMANFAGVAVAIGVAMAALAAAPLLELVALAAILAALAVRMTLEALPALVTDL